MDPRIIEMISTAVKPYKIVGKPGETVAIVTDTRVEPIVWQVFAMAARTVGVTPTVGIMLPDELDYADPPSPIQKMVEGADIVQYCASRGLVHTPWGRKVTQMGKKRVNSDGVTARMLVEGAALADPEEILKWRLKVRPVWDNGNEVHITSPYGTDLRVGIKGHYTYATAKSELVSVVNAQFPGGEEACTPQENTGTGVVVVDKCVPHPTGLLLHPIEIHLVDGKIVDIRGKNEADDFRRWLDSVGDENSRTICELSIGCNPRAIFMGSMRQDRFVLGSSHVGFGGNADLGGTIVSRTHFDVIMSQPTVVIDGNTVVKDGKMMI